MKNLKDSHPQRDPRWWVTQHGNHLRQLDLTIAPLGQVSALSFGQGMEWLAPWFHTMVP